MAFELFGLTIIVIFFQMRTWAKLNRIQRKLGITEQEMDLGVELERMAEE